MSDTEGAQEGKSEFADEFARLAREEAGQSDLEPLNADDRHDQQLENGEPDSGQGEQSPPTSDAETPPAGSENSDDLWANADPHLKAAFEAERARAAKAENVIRSNNGRLSQVQRELAELRAKQATPAAPEAPKGDGVSDEELQRVVEEYPDIGKPLIGVISDLRAQVAELRADRTKQAEASLAQAQLDETEEQARQEQFLAEKHPDWDDVVKTQAFADWAVSQPRMVKEALVRNGNGIVDGPEAAKILSDFKMESGIAAKDPLAAKRQRQLDGSRTVPTRTGVAPGGSGQNASFNEEWKRLAELDRRKAQR